MLYLASSSPRRRELLQQIGVSFQQLKADVDESIQAHELPSAYVQRLALAKAHAGLVQCQQGDLILAADTTVVVDNTIIGKPDDLAHAQAIWRALSGRSHQVLTAIALANHQHSQAIVVATNVYFRAISEEEMLAYWQTGEPQDKAGAYGIQGKGALWVEKIEGSYSNVVGLPLMESAQLLQQFGYRVW